MKLRTLLPLLFVGVAACDSAPKAPPKADWKTFSDAYIEATFKADPYFAVYQGRHEYDGILPDWSKAGINAEIARLKAALADAEAIDPAGLADADRFERDYLIAVTRGNLFWLETARWPYRNPAFYTDGGLDPNVYVARPYAAPDVRLKAFVKYANALPKAAEQIKANLTGPMPRTYIDYGLAAFNGYADYFAKDVKMAFAEVKDEGLQKELGAASSAGAKAMRDLAAFMETKRTGQTEDFVLGPETFAAMVRETEGVDISLDELERIGEADLKRNQAALKSACDKLAPGKSIADCMAVVANDKPADGPVAEARRQLPDLRAFLVKADLVTIPGTEEALVEESPPFNRQNSAYIDIPGPYEKGLPSVYYISPPDPSWPKDVQDGFVPGKLDLLFTSVHEVWPGHFLNFLHANRAKSQFGKVFVGYAFAEGWAHYTEEMMWEAGLNDGDPATHVGQLSNALLRDCRYLSAIGMHARGMSVEQSRQMFRDQCYQDEGNARQQSARGTYDPAYLNYTMGKLLIRKLRENWTASRGGRKAWKAFHDEFLGYGGPPIPLVRKAMMKEPDAKAVF
ncbi:DUF885 domain-containing protein [Sphingosinicella microcystinivorans]|uniref:Uncharacterized protein (DUF885 family) n=1 Tax=Sphingosinicella microcystinivorans TaxID=335406 RepID=A0AAD1D868_SPHMI|nr:DUF885 domain-containing protein [Sphingosinicella microcystinivorans]RKS86582.1 uncharacterized protein (DUF885 family) [Sphingosinicella microcystinivorans]BBE35310.1 hypothetical protein SmB9_29680 [Sphingosinicella microcystinivorans]